MAESSFAMPLNIALEAVGTVRLTAATLACRVRENSVAKPITEGKLPVGLAASTAVAVVGPAGETSRIAARSLR